MTPAPPHIAARTLALRGVALLLAALWFMAIGAAFIIAIGVGRILSVDAPSGSYGAFYFAFSLPLAAALATVGCLASAIVARPRLMVISSGLPLVSAAAIAIAVAFKLS